VLSKGSYGDIAVGAPAADAAFAASPGPHIFRRLCASCGGGPYAEVYYVRYTALPPGFSAYDQMGYNWFSAGNVLGADFGLFGSLDDALARTNAWAACNFDDAGVGFPRDCGPTGLNGGMWSSWAGRGGQDSVSFQVYA
jgi:hypothetical protein